MAFRNPSYLNADLLSNFADYLGLDAREAAAVTRRTLSGGGKGIGVDKVLTARAESSREEELTETYSMPLRPVRLLNALLDSPEAMDELVDLDQEPDAAVSTRSMVQVTGEVIPSPANAVGAIMARLMPLMMSQFSAGQDVPQPSDAQLLDAFAGEAQSDAPQLFELFIDERDDEGRWFVMLEPGHLHGSATFEDVEGEVSLTAHVERVVAAKSKFSLERFFLPGISRPIRRAMGKNGLAHMLESMDEIVGQKIDADALTVHGPAVMLRPLAVY